MFDLFARQRRAKLRVRDFPPEWLAILGRNVPLYGRLSPEHQEALRGHVQVLLAEKHFEGCGGLELDDEIRVTIAAHASLLMLRGEPHLTGRFPAGHGGEPAAFATRGGNR